MVDSLSQMNEMNETNNIVVSSGTTSVGSTGPDLSTRPGISQMTHDLSFPTILIDGPYYLYRKSDRLMKVRDSTRATNIGFVLSLW
ncbi:MAG: hypothetical protein CVV33_06910 [Methanomicrobiales archaeon HGW-Methanomicrobiales-4]|nr:MAG: hypothetical protein CVV33_06910 [Methanomicrobiales archaeon HGW-Methanomicrobiales-4]